ncbi:MAG: electron transport complex subunit E [Planctomycetota bacterium]|nr:electron transport complex subunit E [Planctomycetota bacterium]
MAEASLLREFTKGLIKENPVLVMVLGCCPTLAVTTGVENAIGMGAAATLVLLGSNVIVSVIRRWIPNEIRIACYIVVIASFVSMTQLLVKAFAPDLDKALGIFLPLIVVNCIILARAEAFASKNGVIASALDGLGMGAGFTLAMLVISAIREILGAGKIAGIPITGEFAPGSVLQPATAFVMAPGALLVFGLVLGTIAALRLRRTRAEREARWQAALAAWREVETARSGPKRAKAGG